MHNLTLLPILFLLLSPVNSLDCQDGKIRGVNAGGWLLLEPWITLKLFEEVNNFIYNYHLSQVNVGANLDKLWMSTSTLSWWTPTSTRRSTVLELHMFEFLWVIGEQ